MLKRLLDTSSYNPSQNAIVGLDIGTGASCIYPLLACTQRPWSFLATGQNLPKQPKDDDKKAHAPADIDEKSLGYARLNVKENGLEHRIKIVSRTPDQPMIPIDELESVNVDFVMTNPPFYSSADDLLKSAAQKAHPPHSACTGAEVEMVSPGGEVAFVTRLIEESLLLRNRIQWYTAMFGFLGSVSRIVESLRREGVDNMALMELVQGRTRRWVIGWSFGPMRPANDVARGIMSVSKSILPPKTKSTIIRLPQNGQVGAMADGLAGAVGRLDLLQWDWDKERLAGVGRAPDNVWNRAWRRKKSRTEGSLAEENNRGTFGFRISMHVAREDIEVTAEWLEGHDAAVFESFQGYLKTTMSSLSEPKQQ